MKLMKTIFTFVFVFMVLFCVINGLAFNTSAETGLPVHNIDSGLDYATIQEAIDANETLDGHTIVVDAGTYYEHVVVDKALLLVGESESNTVIDGNGTGVVVHLTTGNVNIMGFTIQNGGNETGCAGVYVDRSDGNNVMHNIIKDNFLGVQLRYSSDNVVSDVHISNNQYGIYLVRSSGNVIFHNDFINNTNSLWSFESANSWDKSYPSGGNYWSCYVGNDTYSGLYQNETGSDGIGDTPYKIVANNTDYFPLMGMVSDFNVVYEHETYRVSIVCNSTVSGFRFDVAAMMLRFNVTGANDIVGFCRVMVPKVLVNWPYVVLVDGEQINSTVLPVSNCTHTFLYFTYVLSGHEVRIISKPYYQLLEKYNSILAEYQKLNLTYYELLDSYGELLVKYHSLNSTYRQLLHDYSMLLANYSQLEDDYDALNATYYEVLGNYTELQKNYYSLNSTYNALNSTYNNLVADYNALNATFDGYKQTHSYSNSEYNTVVADRDYWIAEYDSLNVTYHSLQANHTDLQVDYNNLQAEFNSLNSTYNDLKSEQLATISELNHVRNLMYVFLATTVGAVILVSFSMRYYRMFNKQKKVIERYERELGRLSPLEIARVLFKADVERREAKIGRFEEKYGVRVRPRRTLEDVIKRLELKKKAEE